MAQMDYFPGLAPAPVGSATRAVVVTPDDNFPLPFVARRLYVGFSGNVTVLMRDSQVPVTYQNVPVGRLELCVRQVLATGTTATAIIAEA